MMLATDPDFQRAFKFDLDHEGRVYEDVPGDTGGPTKWGVTWRDGNEWRKSKPLPPLTITQARATRLAYLTPAVIEEIYYTHYWIPAKGTVLPSPLDAIIFDFAVNAGIRQAVKSLQGVLGVAQDGIFGSNTLGGVNRYILMHGQEELIEAYQQRRAEFYRNLARRGSYGKFLRGWLNRVSDLTLWTRKKENQEP